MGGKVITHPCKMRKVWGTHLPGLGTDVEGGPMPGGRWENRVGGGIKILPGRFFLCIEETTPGVDARESGVPWDGSAALCGCGVGA